MISVAEPVLKLKRGDTNDFDMMLFDKIIAYDHLKEKLIIIVNMKTNDTKAQYELAKKDIAEIISTITFQSLKVTGMLNLQAHIQKKNSAKWLRKPRSTSLTAISSNVLFQEDLRRITKIPSSMHTEC